MITTRLTTKKSEFREMLSNLNAQQKRLFSPDEVDYLTNCDSFEYLEFKQEDEDDDEFLKLFSTWLHERPKHQGHVDYYVLFYLCMGETLTREQFEYMERNVAECFDTSHGWIYEINNRIRFKMRVRLICSYKNKMRRLTRKDWREGTEIDENK